MSDVNSRVVETGLNAFCRRQGFATVSNLRLLTGGANMELWSFETGDHELVLRRYRNGAPPESAEDNFSISKEARILTLANAEGVKTPGLIGELETEDGLGPGYVMNRVNGESLPTRMFRDDRFAAALDGLSKELACEAVKIHQTSVGDGLLEVKSPGQLLSTVESQYEQTGYMSPVIAMSLHWLRSNLPSTANSPCMVHGDFRMGNLLVSEQGLTAVLDWELVHLGFPEEDIAWFSMPSWRFGRYEKTAGGIATTEEFVAAYEAAGGRKIDHGLLNWFLIYSSLNWGAMALQMAYWWRSGDDRSLERILVGTRISEVEIDLLLMLEEIERVDHTSPLELPRVESPNQSGDVHATELIEAAIEYLSQDLVSNSEGAAKFHARIAANSLTIAKRIIDLGPTYAEQQAARISALNLTYPDFCEQLMNGALDWRRPNILDHLRRSCLERLVMHQPKYAAIKVASDKWRKS